MKASGSAERFTTLAAAATGATLVVAGLVGFGVARGHAFSGHAGGHILGAFQLNILHSAMHVSMGAVLVGAAVAGTGAARLACLGVGGVLLVLGAVGMLVLGDSPLNVLALNAADNGLHLVVGAGLLAAARALR